MSVRDDTGAPSDTPASGDTSAPADDYGRGQGEILPRDYAGIAAALDDGCTERDLAAFYGVAQSTMHKHVGRVRAQRLQAQATGRVEDLKLDVLEPLQVREVPGHEPTACDPPRVWPAPIRGVLYRWGESTWLTSPEFLTESEAIIVECSEPVEHVVPDAIGLDALALSAHLGPAAISPDGTLLQWFVRAFARTGHLLVPPGYEEEGHEPILSTGIGLGCWTICAVRAQ